MFLSGLEVVGRYYVVALLAHYRGKDGMYIISYRKGSVRHAAASAVPHCALWGGKREMGKKIP